LWLLTDETYKSALKGYLKRKSKNVTEVDENKGVYSFSKETAAIFTESQRTYSFDQKRWEHVARSASAVFAKHPMIFDSLVSLDGAQETRYLATSEGTRIISEQVFYNLTIYASSRATDGMLLSNQLTLYAQAENGLPSPERIAALTEKLALDLEAIQLAPVMEPYTGPAILDGEATGVLFHEVIGHRLEGERQLDDEEGKTFKGQIGNKIIPTFLSVTDDPTVEQLNGVSLNGFYRYDDEGVPAQRVVLIDQGILRNFLMSRTPLQSFSKSNGHGRAAAGEKPRARMGSTWVQSKKTVPFLELKKLLIAEVQKQGKPYGLLIKNILGGSTHTSTWGYQAYKGVPQMVYRVYPDGREELVRGVEIVGTPIASINKIVATSDQLSTFNGFCGAESGYIPVSTIAPDVLMTEIEIQRTMKKSEKDPVLPSPWNGKKAVP
jgi:TldD protein